MHVIDISSHIKYNMYNKSIIIISPQIWNIYRVCYEKITKKISITERYLLYDFKNIKTDEDTYKFFFRQNEVLFEFRT